MSTITAANASYALAIANLYPAPQTLSGFAADAMFATDALENAEVVMGVDGNLSAGFVYKEIRQTISIMPDSPSLVLFETWALAQRTARDIYPANASILIPGIGRKYTMTRGILTSAKFMPDLKKTLASTDFVITWQAVTGEAYSPS